MKKTFFRQAQGFLELGPHSWIDDDVIKALIDKGQKVTLDAYEEREVDDEEADDDEA